MIHYQIRQVNESNPRI